MGWKRCLLEPKRKEAAALTLVTGHTECFLQIMEAPPHRPPALTKGLVSPFFSKHLGIPGLNPQKAE